MKSLSASHGNQASISNDIGVVKKKKDILKPLMYMVIWSRSGDSASLPPSVWESDLLIQSSEFAVIWLQMASDRLLKKLGYVQRVAKSSQEEQMPFANHALIKLAWRRIKRGNKVSGGCF